MTSNFLSLVGHFLIAMPTLTDPFFKDSVVYILAHDAEGALGLTVNLPSGLKLSDVYEQLQPDKGPLDPAHDQAIFIGGPVQPHVGFVLHEAKHNYAGTTAFGELALTASQDAILALAEGTGPNPSLLTLGHAGWSAGQLENELRENAWLSCKADPKIIFSTPVEERRSAAAALLGVDLDRLSHHVGHA
ncbi:YqgE/AlgH family protein [Denitrificimonas sp. JX-1]|uniref:UPF0301 protein TOI97_07355 n=1 Tax=Denitrificimonas halotolerans TaxID=3098930 RepID=A0ABU5GQX8_9GAMM|nr:YqgE/AlgH family protein [Denitrificimonas sp. JX-1]MDY7219383.1 YqgE/AlgH family protein [Denitrificimonas sp. JX-1]